MPSIHVYVDLQEVLQDTDDLDLIDAIEGRLPHLSEKNKARLMRKLNLGPVPDARGLLERAYYDLRGRCSSKALADYFDVVLGRVC